MNAVSERSIRRDAFVLGGAHAALALYYWFGRGVTIVHDYGPDPWGWFWQNLPLDLLRDQPLQSLWYLHAQPPLWNAVGAILVVIFGARQLPALQVLHIVLGSALTVLSVVLAGRLTQRRGWAVAAGVLVGLHPALFLYEAYALYTVLVAFTVVLAAYLLEHANRERSWGWALGFVAAVSSLVLTRSLFHLVLLAGAVLLAFLVAGRPTRRQGAILLLLVLVPVGWYAKNRVQYGFFGASSWYGMGLWRVALYRQDPDTLRSLLAAGVLDPVSRVTPFSPPSDYRALGYDRSSHIPSLARDNLDNVNVPTISAAYGRSAFALIRHRPERFLSNVVTAYGNFSAPSEDFTHLEPNRKRMGFHATLGNWLVGRPGVQILEEWAGGDRYFGSVYFVLFPVVLLLYIHRFARPLRSWSELLPAMRADATAFFLTTLVLYTIAVGCTMELGENVRFKFLVEPAFLVLLLVVASRLRSSEDADRTDR